MRSMRIPWSVIEEIHTIGKKNKLIKKKFLICCNIGFDAPGKTYLKFKKNARQNPIQKAIITEVL